MRRDSLPIDTAGPHGAFEERLRAGLNELADRGPSGPSIGAVRAAVREGAADAAVGASRRMPFGSAALAASVLVVLGLAAAVALLTRPHDDPGNPTANAASGASPDESNEPSAKPLADVEAASGVDAPAVEDASPLPVGVEPLPADTPWQVLHEHILVWVETHRVRRLGVEKSPHMGINIYFSQSESDGSEDACHALEVLLANLDQVHINYDGTRMSGSLMQFR